MMKIMKCSLFILMFFLGTVLPAAAYSEDDSDATLQETDSVEIIIESDSFELRHKEETVVFSKNVIARREDLTIECDEMRVYYSESENGDPDYDKIIATGDVSFTRADDVSGTAEKIVYDVAEATIVMTGQPALKQGKDSYKGSSLTYNVREETITGTDVKVSLHVKKEDVSTDGE